jgi:hypothetical protein
MASSVLTLGAQIPVDGTAEGRADAHAWVDFMFDAAASGSPTGVGAATPAYSKAGGATKDGRNELTPDDLSGVLTALVTGAGGAPLNGGERQMLQGIAECAPAPLPYDDNRALLGSGAKFGNVSSGLARRFWSRGYELPYAPDGANVGYCMDLPVAAVVLKVLGAAGD